MGRIANMLRIDTPSQPDWALLRRLIVANAVLFFSRGNPIVYYGDAQGCSADGHDTVARESLFARQGTQSANDTLLAFPYA